MKIEKLYMKSRASLVTFVFITDQSTNMPLPNMRSNCCLIHCWDIGIDEAMWPTRSTGKRS